MRTGKKNDHRRRDDFRRSSATMRLILISAADANGGAYLHRLFDGHSELLTYPFELQLGTGQVSDGLSDQIQAKYRWPAYAGDIGALTPVELFDAFIDDEVKSYLADRQGSKFKGFALEVDVAAWRADFKSRLAPGAARSQVIEAYVRALFDTWRKRVPRRRETRQSPVGQRRHQRGTGGAACWSGGGGHRRVHHRAPPRRSL